MRDYTSNTDVLVRSMPWCPESITIAAIATIAIIVIATCYFVAYYKTKKRKDPEVC